MVIHDLPVKNLPRELYINGYLDLTNLEELTKLPDKLIVTRGLTINNLPVTSIGDHLEVGEDLTIINCRALTKLPDALYVKGDLQIINCPQFKKYTNDELREMIKSTNGEVEGEIIK
jgi:hypothetical protein